MARLFLLPFMPLWAGEPASVGFVTVLAVEVVVLILSVAFTVSGWLRRSRRGVQAIVEAIPYWFAVPVINLLLNGCLIWAAVTSAERPH